MIICFKYLYPICTLSKIKINIFNFTSMIPKNNITTFWYGCIAVICISYY